MVWERVPEALLSGTQKTMQHEKHGEDACLKRPQVSTKTKKGQVPESDLMEDQTDGEGYGALISA